MMSYANYLGFLGSSVVKSQSDNSGDVDLIHRWRRFPGKISGNLVQYSCLGNYMDR